MTKNLLTKEAPLHAEDAAVKKIEEAAYYCWLTRGRYAQAGDELSDWIEAEKEVMENHKFMLAGDLYQLRGEKVS